MSTPGTAGSRSRNVYPYPAVPVTGPPVPTVIRVAVAATVVGSPVPIRFTPEVAALWFDVTYSCPPKMAGTAHVGERAGATAPGATVEPTVVCSMPPLVPAPPTHTSVPLTTAPRTLFAPNAPVSTVDVSMVAFESTIPTSRAMVLLLATPAVPGAAS